MTNLFDSIVFRKCEYSISARLESSGTVTVRSMPIDGVVHFVTTIRPRIFAAIDRFSSDPVIFNALVRSNDARALEMAAASITNFFMQIMKVIAAYFQCTTIVLGADNIDGRNYGFFPATSSRLTIDEAVVTANANLDQKPDKKVAVSGYFNTAPVRLYNIFALTGNGDYEIMFDKSRGRFGKQLLPHRGERIDKIFFIRHQVDKTVFVERSRQFETMFKRTVLDENQFKQLEKLYIADMAALVHDVYALPPDTLSIKIYADCIFAIIERTIGDLKFNVHAADSMTALIMEANLHLSLLSFEGTVLADFLIEWGLRYIDRAIGDMGTSNILTTRLKRLQMNFYFLDMVVTLLNAQFLREKMPLYSGLFVMRRLVHFPPQGTDFYVRIALWANLMMQTPDFTEQGRFLEAQFQSVLIRATGLSDTERNLLIQ